MYKIKFSKQTENIIEKFINNYKNKYLETFTDTWLYYEDLIRENYINNSKRFKKEIFDGIEEKLKENIVWKKEMKKNIYSTIISIWNIKLNVYYKEKVTNKLRLINKIEFF